MRHVPLATGPNGQACVEELTLDEPLGESIKHGIEAT